MKKVVVLVAFALVFAFFSFSASAACYLAHTSGNTNGRIDCTSDAYEYCQAGSANMDASFYSNSHCYMKCYSEQSGLWSTPSYCNSDDGMESCENMLQSCNGDSLCTEHEICDNVADDGKPIDDDCDGLVDYDDTEDCSHQTDVNLITSHQSSVDGNDVQIYAEVEAGVSDVKVSIKFPSGEETQYPMTYISPDFIFSETFDPGNYIYKIIAKQGSVTDTETDHFSVALTCPSGSVVFNNECCTPEYTSSCDEDDGCGGIRDTDGNECGGNCPVDRNEEGCGESCNQDGCIGNDYYDYPNKVKRCSNGVCPTSLDCTPTISYVDDRCKKSCSELGGQVCSSDYLCFSPEDSTISSFITSSDSRCCSGECRPPCYGYPTPTECKSPMVCSNAGEYVPLETVTYSGTDYSCCNGNCVESPTSCSQLGDYRDCDKNCYVWDGSDYVDGFENVNFGTDEAMLCCPQGGTCSDNAPQTTCKELGYGACKSGEQCKLAGQEVYEYTNVNGLQCCDFPSHFCENVSSETDCPNSCLPSNTFKCSDNTQYTCKYNTELSCYQWSDSQFCDLGCSGNVCLIPVSTPECSEDDDGANYLDYSEIRLGSEVKGADTCDSESGILTEWFCSEGEAKSEEHLCDGGCENGACVLRSDLSESEKIKQIVKNLPGVFSLSEGDVFNLPKLFNKSYVRQYGHSPPSQIGFVLKGLSGSSGRGLWKPDFLAVGNDEFKKFSATAQVQFKDDTFSREMVLNVKNRNDVPKILGGDSFRVVEGKPWRYVIRFSDNDKDDVHTFKVRSTILKANAKVTDDVLVWKNPLSGNYTIQVSVNDGHTTVSKMIHLNVIPKLLIDDMSSPSKKSILSDIVKVKPPKEKVQPEISKADATVVLEAAFKRYEKKDKLVKASDLTSAEDLAKFKEEKKKQADAFIKRGLEQFEETKKHIIVRKSTTVLPSEDKTLITLSLHPDRVMKNVTIYERIPKSVANSVADLEFTVQPIVIETDPLIMWHFEELESEQELAYVVAGEVEKDVQTTTVPIAEEITLEEIKKPKSLLRLFVPLILIPLVSIVIIFFGHFKPKKKPVQFQSLENY